MSVDKKGGRTHDIHIATSTNKLPSVQGITVGAVSILRTQRNPSRIDSESATMDIFKLASTTFKETIAHQNDPNPIYAKCQMILHILSDETPSYEILAVAADGFLGCRDFVAIPPLISPFASSPLRQFILQWVGQSTRSLRAARAP